MTLKEQLNTDVAVLTALTDFGETITYYPGGDTDDGREIPALVDREQPGVMLEDGRVSKWGCVITIRRHATTGILAWTKADLADVMLRYGEAPLRVRVARLDYSDEGLFRLECHR